MQKYLTAHNEIRAREGLEAEEFLDSEVAKQAVAVLSDTIHLPEAAALLGWTVHDCRRLVALGILRSSIHGAGMKPRYAKIAIREFKAALLSRATADPSGLVSIEQVSMRAASGRDDMLRAAFDGRLKVLAYADGNSLRSGLKLSFQELLSVPSEVTLAPKTVCQTLNLEPDTVYRMVGLGIFPNADRINRTVPAEELGNFQRCYKTSAQIKRECGLATKAFENVFRSGDFAPAFPVEEVGQMIFHLNDVPRIVEFINAQLARQRAPRAR